MHRERFAFVVDLLSCHTNFHSFREVFWYAPPCLLALDPRSGQAHFSTAYFTRRTGIDIDASDNTFHPYKDIRTLAKYKYKRPSGAFLTRKLCILHKWRVCNRTHTKFHTSKVLAKGYKYASCRTYQLTDQGKGYWSASWGGQVTKYSPLG